MKFKRLLILFYLIWSGHTYANYKPNVVIIIADDISSTDFGIYGHPVIRTPNIDALAREGMVFTNTYLTTSSCSPSRASILTGRYPHNTGAAELHTDLEEGQVLLPAILRNNGYYTAQAGKWHIGSSPLIPEGIGLQAFDRVGGSVIDHGGYSGSKQWVSYLQERPKDKPFFMWFAAHDAHRGWDSLDVSMAYQPEDVLIPRQLIDDNLTRMDLAQYYKEVSRFDHYVGEVVAELHKQDVLDETIVVIISDNGRPFPRDKTSLYPEGIKTPFVMRYPEVMSSGNKSASLISIIDLAPTILDLVGLPSPETMQGQSFRELFRSPEKPFRNHSFAQHNWHDFKAYERMVTNGDWMYIENGLPDLDKQGAIDIMGGGAGMSLKSGLLDGVLDSLQMSIFNNHQPVIELYNLREDSLCTNSLAGKGLAIEDELKKKLRTWKKQTGDYQPESLTPDWYSRDFLKVLETKGERGEMPGSREKATKICKPGPF